MEEDLHYTSVVFKNGRPPQAVSANKEDQTIYSVVAIKPYSATSAAPNNNTGVAGKKPVLVRCFTAVTVCLCVLLLGSIAALCFLTVSLADRSSENLRLQSSADLLKQESARLEGQRAELQNLTHSLSRQRDRLNWTLQVIMSFSQFPVGKFCPQKQCQPCLDGWIHFENSCYLFYSPKPWKSWTNSQSHCRNQNSISDLVTIDSLQEQEFIHNHTESYFDEFHGYWIGLTQQNDRWVWVDGQTDSLGFWMKTALGASGPKALMIPKQNLTTSWDPAQSKMQNRFICESRALTVD